jgi:hypothetical protein
MRGFRDIFNLGRPRVEASHGVVDRLEQQLVLNAELVSG